MPVRMAAAVPPTQSLRLENASILSEGALQDGHRLWIGNLDPKITEYHLLKLLQKFGKVKQFDFLFHKSGALEGQPRGYCFVNFETKQEAEQAIQRLNGKLALSKKLLVRWAHAQVKRYDQNKNEKALPISLEPSSSTEPAQSNLRKPCFPREAAPHPRWAPGAWHAAPWAQAPRGLASHYGRGAGGGEVPSEPLFLLRSVSTKIKAIEAKLKMMAEDPDAELPPAAPYAYFKPPDKKRTAPYSRAAWKSKR